jgi:hypothetical protein
VTKYFAKLVKTDRITKQTAKKKRNDKKCWNEDKLGRYGHNIVVNTKKTMKTKYINFGLGSDIVSMGEYFLTDNHSHFFLHV